MQYFRSMKILLFLIAFLLATITNAQFHWAKSMDADDTSNNSGQSIKTDAVGNVYITGSFQGSIDFDPGPTTNIHTSDLFNPTHFIQKLDSNGNLIWIHSFIGDFNSRSYGRQLEIDNLGNIYVTGSYFGTIDFDPGAGITNLTSAGTNESFIQKLDSAGNFIWAKSTHSLNATNSASGFGLQLDGNQNVILVGTISGTVVFDLGAGTDTIASGGGLFIQKIDSSGNSLWVKVIGGSATSVFSTSVCTDTLNNIYITGEFYKTIDFDPGVGIINITATDIGNGNRSDLFIEKLDSNGTYQWVKTISSSGNFNANSINLDTKNNLLVTGNFTDTVDFNPGPDSLYLVSPNFFSRFILKLTNSGDFIWVKKNVSINGTFNRGKATTDSLDNIYVLGSFDTSIDLDPSLDTLQFNSKPASTMYIQKLDSAGNLVWAIPIDTGSQSFIEPQSISIDAYNHLYITGYYRGSPDFDPSSNPNILGNNIGQNIFVLKIGLEEIILGANPIIPDDTTGIKELKLEYVSIYPNPSKNELFINSNQEFNQILIINSTGRIIRDIKNKTEFINVSNLLPGIYFIKLIGDNETITRKFIKN